MSFPGAAATPTVSVVIPCYNGAQFLRETLDSALAQTHAPLEIIVVDDGSTDNSAAIAESCGPPVRVVRQKNQGESTARNRGIDEAHGEWVAFLDSDDLWKPTKLARQFQLVGTNESAIGVHTDTFLFGQSEGLWTSAHVSEHDRYTVAGMIYQNPIFISSLLVRRRARARFPVWTRYGEDLLYVLDLTKEGKLVLLEELLTGYRKHEAAQTFCTDVRLRWFVSIKEWLHRNRSALSADEYQVAATFVRRELQSELLHNAYWSREYGAYWRAAGQYCQACYEDGIRLEALTGLAKLPIHRLLRAWHRRA